VNRFCMAINPPKFVFVSAQDAATIVALGAAALAHSASAMASLSSGFTPGSEQEPPLSAKELGCG
jgi:hypothetical protein